MIVRLVLRGLRRRPLAALGAAAMLSSGLLAVLVTTGISSALLFRPISAVHGEALRRIAVVDGTGAPHFGCRTRSSRSCASGWASPPRSPR